MSFKDNLKDLIIALSNGFDTSTIKENKKAFMIMKEAYDRNPNEFMDLVEMVQYDFDTLVSAVINVPPQENDHLIKYIGNGLYEHFHNVRVKNLEGWVCSGDKSKYIKTMTLKALKTGQNLSLFADYKNVEQIKEDKENQAYWSPTSVKDTNEAIALFWNWYNQNS